AFAITVFLWSFYIVGTCGVNNETAIVGMGLFIGSLTQFMAGMREFPYGNIYGSAFFTLYSTFWISYATSLLILHVNTSNTKYPQERDAIGLYLIVWFIVTCFFFIIILHTNVTFILLTFFWSLSYLMLSISYWSSSHAQSLRDAGGALGFVTATTQRNDGSWLFMTFIIPWMTFRFWHLQH
ncbi:Glyoxylate pathway regulator, partial [Leucoagaricus sp. SymC.cos]